MGRAVLMGSVHAAVVISVAVWSVACICRLAAHGIPSWCGR
jgi:hypothetical protein